MSFDRRSFLRLAAAGAAGCAVGDARAGHGPGPTDAQVGCLVDTTLCIGCRQCEEACQRANELPQPPRPFTDRTVFRERRRPGPERFTVVNEYAGPPSPDQHRRPVTHRKMQCMHCLDPACVSACIVGALSKAQDGAVVYNASICIGCRYCMVACPFQMPSYEYEAALAPRVRKCQFCANQAEGQGAHPACAAACPTEALLFGKRDDLLELARSRIEARPDRYITHIYGEHEVGGTSWLYLAGRPHVELDLPELPELAPPRRTEAIQHGIFKYGAAPLAVYAGLGGLMWLHHRRKDKAAAPGGERPGDGGDA
jgi:Fe-S-cluster-containing dehydrogenase component